MNTSVERERKKRNGKRKVETKWLAEVAMTLRDALKGMGVRCCCSRAEVGGDVEVVAVMEVAVVVV